MLAVFHAVLLCGAAALLSLLGLGLSLQLGKTGRAGGSTVASSRPAYRHRHHHRLFFAVSALGWLGSGLGLWLGQRAGGLVAVSLLLLLMPLTRPGQAAHWQLACLTSAAAFLAAWWAW